MKEFKDNRIEFDADVFIIPNVICKVSDFIVDVDEMTVYTENVLRMNGMDPSNARDTYLVQLWFISKELESDNVARHGFHAMVDGKEQRISPFNMEHLPVSLFEGHNEGDTINIKVPVYVDNYVGDDTRTFAEMDITVTLAQLKYRYRAMGKFDELLKELLMHAR